MKPEYSCDYLILGKQTPLISKSFVAFQAGMCENFKYRGSYSKFKTSVKFVKKKQNVQIHVIFTHSSKIRRHFDLCSKFLYPRKNQAISEIRKNRIRPGIGRKIAG